MTLRDKTGDESIDGKWLEFSEIVPTETAATNYMFAIRLVSRADCCPCGRCTLQHKSGERFCTWTRCKGKVWITSGTLFHGVAKLRAWLACAWFKQQGLLLSASKLAKLSGVASSTAQIIHRKINLVLLGKMDLKAPRVALERLAFAIIKRSLNTPARVHPREEKPLEQGAVRLKKCTRKLRAKTIVSSMLLCKIFHGVSRKYLQLYLATLWCYFNDSLWRHNALLIACFNHSPLSYKASLEYSSPPAVRL